jgi:putative PIN family toxin of toxin-antitoxin system
MKVVLDANVYVSSLLTQHGNAKSIIDLWEEEAFELIVSEPILDEVKRVLQYPHLAKIHGKNAREIEHYIVLLRRNASMVSPQQRIDVSVDKSDNRYIECAIEGGADFLVTGDKKHLLPIKEYQGVQIITPATFLAVVQTGSEIGRS